MNVSERGVDLGNGTGQARPRTGLLFDRRRDPDGAGFAGEIS
ncbi:MAG: hypothetical protein OXQ90_09870 [Gammaproteobacteria bacterium]|nr:hypothetical protein [Gammaproteobacteria bacterium]